MVLVDWVKKNPLRLLVHTGSLIPFFVMAWKYWQGLFLVDPVREIITTTGKTALILLILSLSCTPIHTLLGFKPALRVRRALGLYAFGYAALHFLVFIGLDYGWDWPLIADAVFAQQFTLVGFAAGLILLALAITSTQGWMKRLGKRWKQLHRLVYLAGGLVIVHYLWLVKDIREPMVYAGIVAFLLALRVPIIKKAARRLRQQIKTTGPVIGMGES